MKRIIKTVAVLLTLVMLLGMTAMAANPYTFTVTADKQTLKKGESAAVTVTMSGFSFAGAQYVLSWDARLLEASELQAHNGFRASVTDAGTVYANCYAQQGKVSWVGEKQTLSVTLTALADGVSALTLSEVRVYDEEITPQSVALADAPVLTVGSGRMQPDLPDPEPVAAAPRFSDVPQEHWAYEAVEFAAVKGYLTGVGQGRFSPNGAVLRGTFMTVLARIAGADTAGGETWYEKGVKWAVENGVSDGKSPEQPLTREQLVTMLWRYYGSPAAEAALTGFPDTGSDWAQEALSWAVRENVISGIGGRLAPKQGASRAQLAQILLRLLDGA